MTRVLVVEDESDVPSALVDDLTGRGGADGYLVRPFRVGELDARIQPVPRRTSTAFLDERTLRRR